EVAAQGGVLIGLELGYGKFVNNKVVNAMRPIYLTPEGEKKGKWVGATPAAPTTLKAKPGYAVSGITLNTSLGVAGLSLKFAKLDKDRLNLEDNYESQWAGGEAGTRAVLGGKGYVIVGICGHANDKGLPCSLGYVTVTQAGN